MSADTINLSSASKHCTGVGLPRSPMLTAPYSNLGLSPRVARGAQKCQECPLASPRHSPQHALSFGIPAASLPECTGGKSAVCLFFINLHTRRHAHMHRHMPGLRENQIKASSHGGSCKPPPEAGCLRGFCKVIKMTRKGEKSKPSPLLTSAECTGAVNVGISSAVSTQRER